MLGERVFDKSLKGNDSNTFDLTEFTSGTYWVEIQSGYSILKKNLIVLHN